MFTKSQSPTGIYVDICQSYDNEYGRNVFYFIYSLLLQFNFSPTWQHDIDGGMGLGGRGKIGRNLTLSKVTGVGSIEAKGIQTEKNVSDFANSPCRSNRPSLYIEIHNSFERATGSVRKGIDVSV